MPPFIPVPVNDPVLAWVQEHGHRNCSLLPFACLLGCVTAAGCVRTYVGVDSEVNSLILSFYLPIFYLHTHLMPFFRGAVILGDRL